MFQEWLFNVSAPFILRGKDKKYCGIMALSSSQVLKQRYFTYCGTSWLLHSPLFSSILLLANDPSLPTDLRRVASLASCSALAAVTIHLTNCAPSQVILRKC